LKASPRLTIYCKTQGQAKSKAKAQACVVL
jgi:hypothetical protein